MQSLPGAQDSLRRFPSPTNPLPPVPGDLLSTQVLGGASSNAAFLFGGFVVSEGIRDILNLLGRPVESFTNVLDFGCGSARVLRWFDDCSETRWFGSDISQEAIDWNRANLSFGEFALNGKEPPLPFPAASFDLIYAVSVLTHLDEQLQFSWLAELKRILRPGGLILLTVSGESVARWKLSQDEFSEYSRYGFRYQHVQAGGLHGLPDFYQDTYHSRAYVMRTWTAYFQPVAWFRNGPLYLQDSIVLRNEGTPAGPLIEELLPFGSFWTPRIGDVVSDPTLMVAGWTLKHDSPPVTVEFYVDGVLRGEAVADVPTPGVAGVFPQFPAAHNCGFSAPLPIAGLRQGGHILKLKEQGASMPFLSTYFLT